MKGPALSLTLCVGCMFVSLSSVLAGCDVAMMNGPQLILTCTSMYSCDVDTKAQTLCLVFNAEPNQPTYLPGDGWMELVQNLTDYYGNTQDHQFGTGGELDSYIYSSTFARNCYHAEAWGHIEDPDTGAAYYDGDEYSGEYCCECGVYGSRRDPKTWPFALASQSQCVLLRPGHKEGRFFTLTADMVSRSIQ